MTHPTPTHPPSPAVPGPSKVFIGQLDMLSEIAATISRTAAPRTKRSLGPRPAWVRFWEKVDLSGDCWMWRASTYANGYGQFTVLGVPFKAHRWAYQMLVGRIPTGMQLDHVCHTRAENCVSDDTCLHRRCVNPAHLEPVTPRENTRRGQGAAGRYARRTHCQRGHAFDVANTRYTRAEGARICRRCHAINEHARRAKAGAR